MLSSGQLSLGLGSCPSTPPWLWLPGGHGHSCRSVSPAEEVLRGRTVWSLHCPRPPSGYPRGWPRHYCPRIDLKNTLQSVGFYTLKTHTLTTTQDCEGAISSSGVLLPCRLAALHSRSRELAPPPTDPGRSGTPAPPRAHSLISMHPTPGLGRGRGTHPRTPGARVHMPSCVEWLPGRCSGGQCPLGGRPQSQDRLCSGAGTDLQSGSMPRRLSSTDSSPACDRGPQQREGQARHPELRHSTTVEARAWAPQKWLNEDSIRNDWINYGHFCNSRRHVAAEQRNLTEMKDQ